MKKLMILLAGAAALGSVEAARLSSLTVTDYFDNRESPAARVVAPEDTMAVTINGAWFPSGACELLVDGVTVASSSGSPAQYAFTGGEAVAGYWITLRSREGEMTKYLTLKPSAALPQNVHSITSLPELLDTECGQGGKVIKILSDRTMEFRYSGLWDEEAGAINVSLHHGHQGTMGAKVTQFDFNRPAGTEGEGLVDPTALALEPGDYTIVLDYEIEAIYAYLRVAELKPLYLLIR